MADEWSKPVKLGEEWPMFESRTQGICPLEVSVSRIEVGISFGHEGQSAPRDVVLRLLAAEASDRLGWVWEVERLPDRVRVKTVGSHYVSWAGEPPTGTVDIDGTPDEILAAMHGRFLLEDAIREAGA